MTAVMEAASFAGSSGVYLTVLAVLYWCVSARAGYAAVILLFSFSLNTILKLVAHAPRPYWTDPAERGHASEGSFGMPSGHAQSAAVVWGMVALTAGRRWVWAVAAAMALLIGASRVYLGAHSPGQVLAGWAIGAGVLAVALTMGRRVARWWAARPIAVQVALALAASLAVWGLAAWAEYALGHYRMPVDWMRAVRASGGTPRPLSLVAAEADAGALFGLLTGLSLLGRAGGFDPAGGAAWQRAARLPVGLAGTVLAGFVLWPLGAYVQAAGVALWVGAGAPVVFVRLGLAHAAPR